MTERLSPEAIAYIVEWAASGNEDRSKEFDLCVQIWAELHESGALGPVSGAQLSPAGLTIAALARENGRRCDD